MRCLFLIVWLLSQGAQAVAPRCSDLFRPEEISSFSDMMDESGFINLYGGKPRRQPRPEPTPEPVVSRTSLESLQALAQQGRKSVRKNQWPRSILETFMDFTRLSNQEVATLTIPQTLALLNAFGHWNLLIPRALNSRLQSRMQADLTQWSRRDFLEFALFRKISPQVFSGAFLRAYRQQVLLRFPELNASTQLEVLAAEIMQGSRWSLRQTKSLLEQTSLSVETESGILRLKPLKEMFRALSYLRASEPTFFFPEIVRLESALETQLNRQDLSLQEGGTSGSNNPQRPFGPSFIELQNRIDGRWPGQEKVFEAMEPQTLGLFDPVDLYYPNLRLVVEWDGPIHYFRQLNSSGRLDSNAFVLRPIDSIKDQSLRQLGISVLRWPKHLNHLVERVDIEGIILSQNPQTWDQRPYH